MLRVTCPCGAPYSLGDHLAGRSFKCPKCGRVLKVGAPSGAGPAPQQAPPQGGWGQPSGAGRASGTGRPSGAARPSGAGRTSGTGRPSGSGSSSGYGWGATQGGTPPAKKPSGGDELGFADDDGLLNSRDNSREAKQPSPAQLRRSGSGRAKRKTSGRTSARTSSAGRSSGAGPARGNRRSSSRQAAAGPPGGGGAHSRNCPVCDELIAKVAPECPSCGVVLKGPSAVQRLQGAFDWSKLTGAIFPLAVIGAIGYGWTVYRGGDEPNDVVVRPTVKVSETPEPTPTETPEPTPSETPEATPAASKAPVDVIIPAGDHALAFERLRDAVHPRDVHQAVEALAEAEDVRPALEQALASTDAGYTLKVHRAALRAGDEDTRRTYIDASLTPRSGDTGIPLLYTAIAALDLDAPLYGPKVLELNRNEIAQEWGKLAIQSELPDARLVATTRAAADPVTRQLLEIAFCYDRDGSYLESAVDALEFPSPTVRKVALKGIRELAGDLGPDSEEVDPWREWAKAYAPVRALLGEACADYQGVERSVDDGFAACLAGQKAAKQLCDQAKDVFEFLPVFFRDKVSESPRTGKLLGLLLAKVGDEHPAAAKALLDDLDRSDMDERGGAELVRGVMLGLGTASAATVAKAVSRGAISITDDPYLFPVFVERASADDVEPFLEAVLASGEQARGAAWISFSATRALPKHVEAWLRDSTVEERYEVAARLAWEDFQNDLFDTLQKKKFWNPPFNTSSSVAHFLGRVGTNELADDFAKLAGKEVEQLELYDAFGRLGKPEDIKGLKSIATDKEVSTRVAERVFKAIAAAAGPAAYDYLEKRLDEEDPHRNLALFVIRGLDVDDKSVRRETAAHFEGENASRAVADPRLVSTLGRVGRKAEQKLLWRACREGLGENAYRYTDLITLFVALGRMGYDQEIFEGLEGYLYAGHRLTGLTATCFSLFFHDERDPEAEAAVAEKLANACAGVESLTTGQVLALAALATIDREQAGPPAVKAAKITLESANSRNLEPVAYALAAVGEPGEEALSRLCAHPRLDFRQRVARGVALAAVSGLIPASTGALEQLRYDRDEEIRGLAALALGLLGDKTVAKELSHALGMRKSVLVLEPQPADLARIVPIFDDLPVRVLFWRSAEALLEVRESDRARWHAGIGEGRIEEITRDLRRALLELR